MIEKTKGLMYPIVKDPLGFFRSSQGLDVIKSDLMILLLTNPGERVMLSNYGTNLREYFFEPNDTTVAQEVKELISNAISTWEPRIVVEDIEVNNNIDNGDLNAADTLDQKEHILSIKINFLDPENIAQVDSLTLELPGSNETRGN